VPDRKGVLAAFAELVALEAQREQRLAESEQLLADNRRLRAELQALGTRHTALMTDKPKG
jgi:hypothetical protein